MEVCIGWLGLYRGSICFFEREWNVWDSVEEKIVGCCNIGIKVFYLEDLGRGM